MFHILPSIELFINITHAYTPH